MNILLQYGWTKTKSIKTIHWLFDNISQSWRNQFVYYWWGNNFTKENKRVQLWVFKFIADEYKTVFTFHFVRGLKKEEAVIEKISEYLLCLNDVFLYIINIHRALKVTRLLYFCFRLNNYVLKLFDSSIIILLEDSIDNKNNLMTTVAQDLLSFPISSALRKELSLKILYFAFLLLDLN